VIVIKVANSFLRLSRPYRPFMNARFHKASLSNLYSAYAPTTLAHVLLSTSHDLFSTFHIIVLASPSY